MKNGGENSDRSYDAEYCKRAAEVLGKVLAMVEGGQTQYALVDFEHHFFSCNSSLPDREVYNYPFASGSLPITCVHRPDTHSGL